MNNKSLYMALVISLGLSLSACSTIEKTAKKITTPAIEPPQLIDREVFFGNPTRYQGRLSPDGSKMSYRAPFNGVMNLWVGNANDFSSMKPITMDKGRGIPNHYWALDSRHIFYEQDTNGDENYHLFVINLATGKTMDLTPMPNIRVMMLGQSSDVPGVIMVGINDRDPKWHDIYRIDFKSGKRTLVEKNNKFGSFVLDHNLNPRVASNTQRDGSLLLYKKLNGDWEPWFTLPAADYMISAPLQFNKENTALYLLDSRNRNTAALVLKSLNGTTQTLIAEAQKVDIGKVIFHPKTREPIAYQANYLKTRLYPIGAQNTALVQAFNKAIPDTLDILAQTSDNRYWTVYTNESDRSPVYKVYDTQTTTMSDMFVVQPELDDLPLVKRHGVVIKSRDNLDLVSYLTLPYTADPNQDGIADAPSPMIMLVHGGPWGRDYSGYDSLAQMLANRGYSVLQVNFRSSTGFGKSFVNAGNGEWAGAMHNDLLDAKKWAIQQGVTANDTVGIMGISYGGYATLVGLTFTPNEFQCGVDIVGPSNLVTLLESIPPYWESFRQVFYNAIGNPETASGLASLKARSPINKVANITKPLLIGQGANDPRVVQSESDQIVNAMLERDIPVTYVVYPDEGHGFEKPENRLSFFAISEGFLGNCLGGRVQPIGDDFENSSVQIPYGKELLPSLISKSN